MYKYDETNNCWIPLRTTSEYKKKRKIVRDAWIGVALTMIFLPVYAVFTLCLLSTFVSLMFLDESKYSFEVFDRPQ